MIKFEINSDDLNERELPYYFRVYEILDIPIIKECIDLFNSEIVWEGMFTIEDAEERFKIGHRFFVGYYMDEKFGYCWLNKSENIFKIYNVFSKKSNKPRKYGATDMLYYVIKNYTKGIITADVDEWNIKSINVFKKLGFTEL